MIMKATIAQTKLILKRKEAICVFYILFIMVLANFIRNVSDFQGSYIQKMCHPMRLLLLSYDRTNWNAGNTILLIQVYPLLVACAAGFSLAREYRRGTQVFLVSRLGNCSYHVSKISVRVSGDDDRFHGAFSDGDCVKLRILSSFCHG